jgi:hypothetical protein
MLKGIFGNPYIDLSTYIDLTSFDKLHPEICKGFAVARDMAAVGSVDVPEGFMNLKVYNDQFKPLYVAYNDLLNLSDDNPIKINGKELKDNELSTYLKFAMGAYDLYSFYVLYDFKDGWREDETIRGRQGIADYFPAVISWIDSLVENKVFSHIGRATFFVQEAGGISFEHKDPSVDPEYPDVPSEFIHLSPSLDRPFYVRDFETEEKTYIRTRAGYWNDQDYHGGDPVMKPTYSLRIDGRFTDEFKAKIKNGL